MVRWDRMFLHPSPDWFECNNPLSLPPQMNEAADGCQPPRAGSHRSGRTWSLGRVALSALGATVALLLGRFARETLDLYF